MSTPNHCATCGTEIEDVPKEDVPKKTQCLRCHLEQKQSYIIRKSYRDDTQTFEKLEEEMGGDLIKILDEKYAILRFSVSEEGRKTFSFNEFHRKGDKNFFGDRPGIYLFTSTIERKDGNEYVAKVDDDYVVKVGETRNLSQRLRTHKGKLMVNATQGLIIFCCTKENTWEHDPLNSSELRLTIERILQANFETGKSRTEKWVTPTAVEWDIAEEICEELHKNKGKWTWLDWKYETLVFPAVWKI